MKKSQRVIAALCALILVFNIGISSAKANPAIAVPVGMEILKWLGVTIGGTAVAWGTGKVLDSLFPDDVPTNQPIQSYYTAAVSPVSRPTIYNPQVFNTTNTTQTTNNTKIVNTYNKTITTINNTTNNYEIKNYETINYNNEYNMYYTQIDNYNYYITYAPTYTNITYIDSHATSMGDAYSYNLYYQLPDGRNSYDLTASDVWGTVFLSDFANYQQVPEDDGKTLALYHFDGDIRDASAKNGNASYAAGASYTFVDSGSFGRALYWDASSHQLNFDIDSSIGTGDYTVEFRVYTSRTGMPNISLLYDQIPNPDVLSYREITHMEKNGYVEYPSFYAPLGGTPDERKQDRTNWFNTTFNDIRSITSFNAFRLSDILKNGENAIVSYAFGANTLKTNTQTSGSNIKYEWLIQGNAKTGFVNSSSLNFNNMDVAGHGIWNTIAIVRQGGNKSVYINGVKGQSYADSVSLSDVFTLTINNGMFDYLYLDELRVTNQALYTSNYTPSSMPFDTNLVLVLPQNSVEDRIAIKSNIAVTSPRIGGVRPTYPSIGNVYISLDTTNKVESIQQYNGSDWVDTDAAIYKGEWKNLDKYDMTSYIVDEDDFPDYNDANIIGKYNIVYLLTNLTVNSGVSTIANGETFHMTLIADDGFILPETVQVVMGMQELEQGIDFTYTDGEIKVPNVSGNLYVSAAGGTSGTGNHSISYSLTNVMLKNQARTEGGFTAAFEVAQKFDMPSSIKVIMGDTELSPITGYTYSNGVLSVPNMIEDVLVVASAKVNENAVTPTPAPTSTPPPTPGDDDEGLSGLWDFIEDILNFVIDGIGSLLSTITNLLSTLQNFGTGFVEFLGATLSFIPTEITTMLALGVGLMIVLAVIKMIKG